MIIPLAPTTVRKAFLSAVVLAALALLGAVPAQADYLKHELAGGTGQALVTDGAGGHYVGGSFNYWNAESTGGGVVLKDMTYSGSTPSNSGTLNRNFKMFDGGATSVRIVISDGSDGWYVGGNFTRYGKVKTNTLVHIKGDGSLDTAFTADIPLIQGASCDSGGIKTLLLEGETLWIGGYFTSVNGTARNDLAAVNASTGELKSFDASVGVSPSRTCSFQPGVTSLLRDGSSLFIGGSFPSVGGDTGSRALAKVDATSGVRDSTFSGPGPVYCQWPVGCVASVTALAKVGADLWVGTNYKGGLLISDSPYTALDNSQMVVMNPTTKAIDVAKSNKARLECTECQFIVVNSIVNDGEGHVYVSGAFDRVGYGTDMISRSGVAKYDIATGKYMTTFNANVQGAGNTCTGEGVVTGNTVEIGPLVLDGSSIYLTGRFSKVGSADRSGLAAVDKDSGALDGDFAPAPLTSSRQGCAVTTGLADSASIAKSSDGSLFVGGYFDAYGGTKVGSLIHVKADGTLDQSFNASAVAKTSPKHGQGCWPFCRAGVSAMARVGDKLYVGGMFDSVGGNSNLNVLAVLNAADGSLASRQVVGRFVEQTQGINATSTTYTPRVLELEVVGTTVWLAGSFDYQGDGGASPTNRSINIVGIDTTTDTKTAFTTYPWTGGKKSVTSDDVTTTTTYPAPQVVSLAISDGRLFASSGDRGAALSLTGNDGPQGTNLSNFGLFALSTSTGSPVSGALGSGIYVGTCRPTCGLTSATYGAFVRAAGSRLFIGGDFSKVGTSDKNGLAEIDPATGAVKSFKAELDSCTGCSPSVSGLLAGGDSLYVIGSYATIGGQSRGGIAQINLVDDSVTAFDPLDGSYWRGQALYLDPSDSRLYTAGVRTFPNSTEFPTSGVILEPTLRYTNAPLSQLTFGYMVTVQLRPPPAPTISAPAAGATSNTNSVLFSIAAGNTAECQIDGGDWTACTSPLDVSGLSDGSHTVSVRQTDADNRTSSAASVTWTVDRTAPASTPAAVMVSPSPLVGGATSQTTAQFTFGPLPADATAMQCKLDGGAWADCTSPYDVSGLADGQHTVKFRFADAAGNTGAEQSITWGVYSTAPAAPTVTAPVDGSASNANAVTFVQVAGLRYTCELDGAAPVDCTSPLDVSGLADGSHNVKVRAVDPVGNTSSPTSVTWTRDTSAPAAPTITSKPPATTTDVTASIGYVGSGESGATFECRVDGGAAAACSGNPVQLLGLAVGAHDFEVREVDAAGNRSPAASTSWTVQASSAPCTPRAVPPTPTRTVKLTRIRGGFWVMNAGSVFNTGGDTRGCARILTIQVSVDPVRPLDSLPHPTVISFQNGILAWTGKDVSRNGKQPRWMRVGNRIGRWTGWVEIKY